MTDTSMFKYAPAKRADSHVMVSLAGASGTGKTYSALRLATGLSGDKPFAVLDTEAGRALHYTDDFKFDHSDFAPPFTPERYTEAVDAAVKAGYKAIVIDSMSHEFDGEGGIFEAAESGGGKGPGKWLQPKMRHKKMMNKFLQVRAHLIFCLRAERKIDMTQKDSNGKMIVVDQGWVPICEKKFGYEMTIRFTLNPTAPGMVDLTLPHKVEDHHRMAFMPGAFIDEAGGRLLADWSQGKTVETPNKKLWDQARRIAQEGGEALKTFWSKVATEDDKVNLRVIGAQLRGMANTADANKEPW